MAFEEKLESITRLAGADLSSHQYKFVKLNTSGKAVIVDTDGEAVVGVLQNKPDAADREATVGVEGISKVISSGVIAAGAKVTTNDSGLAKTAASGDHVLGMHVGDAAAAANDVIPVLLISQHLLA